MPVFGKNVINHSHVTIGHKYRLVAEGPKFGHVTAGGGVDIGTS